MGGDTKTPGLYVIRTVLPNGLVRFAASSGRYYVDVTELHREGGLEVGSVVSSSEHSGLKFRQEVVVKTVVNITNGETRLLLYPNMASAL